jgi:CBS-domain-containing membrane protein
LFEGRRRRGERTKASARTVADLMSMPPVIVPASTSLAAAARLMDTEGVKRLPVVDDLGRLIGIVSRGDLLKVHLRPDDELLAEVESDVLRTFLAVRDGVVTLTGRVDRISTKDIAARLIRKIPGVVAVVDELEYNYDDRAILGTGIGYGVA